MKRLSTIANRLFGSLPGLLVVAVACDALIIASLFLFSGPVRGLGLADLLGMDFSQAQRVGRIIMLYHSLAIPFVAALVYLILDQVPVGSAEEQHRVRRSITVPVTIGYVFTSIGGMTFAYSHLGDGAATGSPMVSTWSACRWCSTPGCCLPSPSGLHDAGLPTRPAMLTWAGSPWSGWPFFSWPPLLSSQRPSEGRRGPFG